MNATELRIGKRISYYRKPFGSRVFSGVITDITPGVVEVQPNHRKRGVHYIAARDIDSGEVVVSEVSQQ